MLVCFILMLIVSNDVRVLKCDDWLINAVSRFSRIVLFLKPCLCVVRHSGVGSYRRLV